MNGHTINRVSAVLRGIGERGVWKPDVPAGTVTFGLRREGMTLMAAPLEMKDVDALSLDQCEELGDLLRVKWKNQLKEHHGG